MPDLNFFPSSSFVRNHRPLVARCQREYRWDETKCRKVLNAYQQFFELKKYFQDWDATILSPSQVVDQMWHQHLLDVTNYCHDTILLFGHVVGHNPDGALDSPAKAARTKTTRDALFEHFGSDYDKEMWLTPTELREEERIDSVKKQLRLKTKEVHSMNSETDSNSGTPFVVIVNVVENNQKQTIQFGSRQTMDKVLSWYSTNVYRYNGNEQGSHLDLKFYRRVNYTYRPIDRNMNAEELKFNSGEEIKVFNNKIPITLRFRDQTGEETFFKIKRSSRLSKVFDTYASSKGVELQSLEFYLEDGEIIRRYDTPFSFELNDNDQIDVILNQSVAVSNKIPITLRLRDQTREETFFKIKRSSRLSKVFDTYARMKGVESDSLRFLFGGRRIYSHQTPLDLDLEDQDQIDVMLERSGC
jgi:hypothetical protein